MKIGQMRVNREFKSVSLRQAFKDGLIVKGRKYLVTSIFPKGKYPACLSCITEHADTYAKYYLDEETWKKFVKTYSVTIDGIDCALLVSVNNAGEIELSTASGSYRFVDNRYVFNRADAVFAPIVDSDEGTTGPFSESELIEMAKEADEEAFEELVAEKVFEEYKKAIASN